MAEPSILLVPLILDIQKIQQTGHRVPARFELLEDMAAWLTFYTLAQSWRTWRRITGNQRPTMAFYPEKPRPWYFIWPVMHASGVKLISDVGSADIVFQFDDSTESYHEPPAIKPGARLVNFKCNGMPRIPGMRMPGRGR